MAQRAQVVDITKSFLPGDPNAYVQSLVNTDREDGEEKTLPLMPYEGYNFLPTAYGYKSYFGTNSPLSISALASRVQFVLLYQIPTYKSRLIALAEDGIWVCTADGQHPDWVQVVTHAFDANTFEEWTWCIIENVLYMYKQGGSLVYKTAIGTWTIPAGAPTVGDIVGLPSAYQTFNVTDGGLGSDTDFWNGNYYEVYLQYSDGTDFGLEGLYWGDFANSTTSFSITVSGTPPNTADRVRVYIYDDDLGDTFYKDFLLTDFPLSILDLTGFSSSAGFEAQTLYEDGAPTTPELILSNDLTITSFAPSFLTMAGQMGIFRAGTRLGFWDSANSVSWSSNFDLSDFTPSIENMAGNTIFGSVTGRILHCRSHGEGFIIYSTKSIVGATFMATGNLLWDGKKVYDNSGISCSRSIATGKTDGEHFVFSNAGILTIGAYNSLAGKYATEVILTDLFDLLKESRDPVYVTCLQDRYLCFSVISDDYISGRVSFYTGVADPLTTRIDWYLPSETYPTGTNILLGDQLWEIIKNEMSGQSQRRRDRDGIWVPLYTTTIDRMDTAYYAWWQDWFEDVTGLVSYQTHDASLDVVPLTIDASFLSTNLNPPVASSRFGTVRTFTALRAFPYQYTGGPYDVRDDVSNEMLIWAQESEWREYKEHQLENMERMAAYQGQVITYTNRTKTITRGTSASVNTVGRVATTTRTDTYTYNSVPYQQVGTLVETYEGIPGVEAPAVSWTGYPSTESGVAANIAAWTAHPGVTGSYTPGLVYYIMSGSITFSWNGSSWQVSGGSISAIQSPAYADAVAANIPDPATSTVNTVLGTVITGDGNNEWLTTRGPAEDAAAEVILRRTFNKAYRVTKTVATVYTHDTVVELSYREIATETTTYTYEEITQNMGYSQIRMLVTHWDKVKPGLYGDWTQVERVAASAMTPKVFDGTYPTDRGTGREEIWSYGDYKAQRLTDFLTGTIGPSVFSPNPSATPNLTITGYNENGITSAHTEFTLPGATFLFQTGSITPAYNTFTGALVFDLQLKKWGKYKGDHKLLVETVPTNSSVFDSITFSDLGASAGIFSSTGILTLFDSIPEDSWIRYGKLGYYRQGMTNALEVKAQMRYPNNFQITIESSMDGKLLDIEKSETFWYWDEIEGDALPDVSARWHTIKISGNYDLTGLEVRATIAGRR